MSPEQALGHRQVDGRADIYALGCVGYWLVTGALVFPRATAMAMAVAHSQTAPEPPSHRTELPIPASFDALILECLAKSPAMIGRTRQRSFPSDWIDSPTCRPGTAAAPASGGSCTTRSTRPSGASLPTPPPSRW